MRFLNDDLKIVHRDLKGQNIFLHETDQKLQVKVGDLADGLNHITNFKRKYFEYFGTTHFKVVFY